MERKPYTIIVARCGFKCQNPLEHFVRQLPVDPGEILVTDNWVLAHSSLRSGHRQILVIDAPIEEDDVEACRFALQAQKENAHAFVVRVSALPIDTARFYDVHVLVDQPDEPPYHRLEPVMMRFLQKEEIMTA